MHKSLAFELPRFGTLLTSRLGAVPRLPLALGVIAALIAWTALAPVRLSAQDSPQPPSDHPMAPAQAFDLSDEVVRDVLTNFQRGIETRNLDRVLATFDPDSTNDFPQVREQFVAFFRLHDNIKFRYQLLQATAEKDVAYATADVDMDAEPRDDLPTEQRHSTQMRFQMKMTPKGWKLIGIKPMDFFNQ